MAIPHYLREDPSFVAGYEFTATELGGEPLEVRQAAARAMRAELERFSGPTLLPPVIALFGGLHWIREQAVVS